MQQKLEKTMKGIEVAISKLTNGSLTIEDMDALVNNAHSLYETSLILRYKAYETKVFGSVESQELAPTIQEIDKTSYSDQIIPRIEEPELPQIEFSLFDVADETENHEVEHAVEQEEESIEAPQIEEVWVINETIVEVENEINEQESEIEATFDMEKSGSHEIGAKDEFMEKFNAIDPSIANQIAMSRLDTLIGSFGLNERLQFINELFDGSSEEFSEAIKTIDSLPGQHEALSRASSLATQYNWDKDSETVEDFVLKIKRRHA